VTESWPRLLSALPRSRLGESDTDLTGEFMLGCISFIIGFVTEKAWGLNLNKLMADVSLVFVLLPFLYLAVVAPFMPLVRFIDLWTAYLVSFFEGLPAMLIGDVGGTVAAAALRGLD